VRLSVCSHDNLKTNDPKVFKLGIGNDDRISYKWYDIGLKGQRSRSQGHKSAKNISVDQVADVSYALASAHPLVATIKWGKRFVLSCLF